MKLTDVAAAAHVSTSVVSRVLNADASLRIRDETRDRVMQVAGDLGYRPNAAARALRMNSAEAIGVFIPNLNNPFFAELLRGIEAGCDETGFIPMIGRSERLEPTGGLLERLVREGRIDGAVIQLTDVLSDTTIEHTVTRDIPTVFITSHTVEWTSSVVLDDVAGVAEAARYLLGMAHTDIGFIGGLPMHDTAIRREEGFRETMRAEGLTPRDDWITRLGFSRNDGEEAFDQVVGSGTLPTGLVVANVNAALGVLRGARLSGVSIPDDLSVVALHDSEAAEHSWPPLTTIRMPLYELGHEAVVQLAGLLDGNEMQAVTIREPLPRIVVRESVRAME